MRLESLGAHSNPSFARIPTIATPDLILDIYPGLHPAGGIGRYVRDLCDVLGQERGAPSYALAYPRPLRERARQRYGHARLCELPAGWIALRLLYLATMPLGIGMDSMFGRSRVVHSPMGYGPLFTDARLLLTLHDLTFLEHPEWHPKRTTFFLERAVPIAARSAARIVCDSDYVRSRVQTVLGVGAERTLTIPLGVAPHFSPAPQAQARARIRERFGIAGPFVLHVGTLEPRKNHITLIEAYEHMRERGFAGPLVLVGREGWKREAALARLVASRVSADILRIREADDADLVALYSCASVSAFPSLEEGFGYPLLESMACGCPCVASDHAALVELAGGAAMHVPALDAEALAASLLRVANDAQWRAERREAGLARAERYSMSRWGQRMVQFYKDECAAASS